ncbi:hypothetical protein G6011_00721 [Alternaria panax]|uniref:Uncharacterized protein n=1 Tax=Alternaria panax TaxID=48097 RepID=A0AAD4IJ55_9PLEO|nr:hypothetical protein G6011_00721 [Alternaria panax]
MEGTQRNEHHIRPTLSWRSITRRNMAIALYATVADSLAKRFTTLLSASTSCNCMRSEYMSTAISVGEDHDLANEHTRALLWHHLSEACQKLNTNPRPRTRVQRPQTPPPSVGCF